MKTVNFTKIAIQNFLSIGEEPVVVFFKQGLHVLTGSNKDKPDRQNAVGKSAVADALYFAIFGETLREIKKELIINNITGGKSQVELEFEVDSPRGNNKFKIIRTLSPTKVQIYKDGIDKTRDSISNTTQYIREVLSASPAIFQNCVIMTVNNAIPFMAKNKTEKRRFIEDIFGMEVFSKMIAALRIEYNEVKRDHDIQSTKISEITTSLTNLNLQKERNLEKKQEKLQLYIDRQQNNSQEIKHLESQTDNIVDKDSIDIYNQQIKNFNSKLNTCESEIITSSERSSNLKTIITHKRDIYVKIGTDSSTCPVCLQSVADHDKELIKLEKKKLKDEIIKHTEDLKSILTNIQYNKDCKIKIKSNISQTQELINKANLQLQFDENIGDQINKLTGWQAELALDIEELKQDTNEFDELIAETEGRRDEHNITLADISNRLGKLDVVKFIVSEEGVKSFIVDKLLGLLNNKLYFYLKKLESNSTCVFNEYFEEEIINDNNKICSYFNFSGAERKSIDLACLFAFSDIRRLQGGVSYNIAIYDELFDSSFDEKGIELITDILQERVETLKECTIVISHRKESLKAVTGDVIWLIKQNGITSRVDFNDQ